MRLLPSAFPLPFLSSLPGTAPRSTSPSLGVARGSSACSLALPCDGSKLTFPLIFQFSPDDTPHPTFLRCPDSP